MPSVIMLIAIYVEWHLCWVSQIIPNNPFLLSVIMLSVTMLNVIMLRIIMLSVIMLSVIMLNAIYAESHK